MKTLYEAEKINGVTVCKHEIEILCSQCSDPVSEEEKITGTCTNCGATWAPIQSVSVWATSVPAGAKTMGQQN